MIYHNIILTLIAFFALWLSIASGEIIQHMYNGNQIEKHKIEVIEKCKELEKRHARYEQ